MMTALYFSASKNDMMTAAAYDKYKYVNFNAYSKLRMLIMVTQCLTLSISFFIV